MFEDILHRKQLETSDMTFDFTKVFPNILKNYKNNKWLSERAILAPKNIDVHEINIIVLTKIQDQAVLYKSVDTFWNQMKRLIIHLNF